MRDPGFIRAIKRHLERITSTENSRTCDSSPGVQGRETLARFETLKLRAVLAPLIVSAPAEATVERWKEAIELLQQVDPALWPDVVVGDSTAFRAFNAHFSEGPHAQFDTAVSA